MRLDTDIESEMWLTVFVGLLGGASATPPPLACFCPNPVVDAALFEGLSISACADYCATQRAYPPANYSTHCGNTVNCSDVYFCRPYVCVPRTSCPLTNSTLPFNQSDGCGGEYQCPRSTTTTLPQTLTTTIATVSTNDQLPFVMWIGTRQVIIFGLAAFMTIMMAICSWVVCRRRRRPRIALPGDDDAWPL